mgnify:CR=1 FL=1
MTEAGGRRAAEYASEFEAAQQEFIRLVESLTDEQWRKVGKNFPQRISDEDEGRRLGVIAHHVATSGLVIIDRIQRMLDGRPRPQVGVRSCNAKHAEENADVTKEDVLAELRKTDCVIAYTGTQPLRTTGTTDTSRRVRWVAASAPTIGGGDAVDGPDVWAKTA